MQGHASARTCSRVVLSDALNRAGVRLSWSTVASGTPLSRSAACDTMSVPACSGRHSAHQLAHQKHKHALLWMRYRVAIGQHSLRPDVAVCSLT